MSAAWKREAADALLAIPPATGDGPFARWLRDRANTLTPPATERPT